MVVNEISSQYLVGGEVDALVAEVKVDREGQVERSGKLWISLQSRCRSDGDSRRSHGKDEEVCNRRHDEKERDEE